MTADEATQRADDLVFQKYGVRGDPISVRLVKVRGRRKYLTWWLMYPARLFYPDVYDGGGVVDGGEVIVHVDDATGQVAAWHHP